MHRTDVGGIEQADAVQADALAADGGGMVFMKMWQSGDHSCVLVIGASSQRSHLLRIVVGDEIVDEYPAANGREAFARAVALKERLDECNHSVALVAVNQ